MQDKSIMLVVGSIVLAGLLISSAIIYNGAAYRRTVANTGGSPTETGTEDYITYANLELELAEVDPYEGSKSKSQIAIIEFSDYECPFCKRFHEEARKEIIDKYVKSEQAILVWKDLPLSFHDPLATKQAIAAQCVNTVAGKEAYFEMNNAIFEATKSNGNGMKEEQLRDLADQIEGLDLVAYDTCYQNEETRDIVEANAKLAADLGINGTPGFVIGKLQDGKITEGVRVSGALPFSSFEEVIEGLLE